MRTVTVAALFLAGCTASSAERPASSAEQPAPSPLSNTVDHPVAAPLVRSSDHDAIRLAVFRYLVDHNDSGLQTHAPFVCLEVHDGDQVRDPSPFIMAGMSGSKPRAVPRSDCESNRNGVFLKDDPAAGRGLIFRTGEIEIDGNTIIMGAGYYEAGLSASGGAYFVVRQSDGSWLVTKHVTTWVS